jgi:hypothetical protein
VRACGRAMPDSEETSSGNYHIRWLLFRLGIKLLELAHLDVIHLLLGLLGESFEGNVSSRDNFV